MSSSLRWYINYILWYSPWRTCRWCRRSPPSHWWSEPSGRELWRRSDQSRLRTDGRRWCRQRPPPSGSHGRWSRWPRRWSSPSPSSRSVGWARSLLVNRVQLTLKKTLIEKSGDNVMETVWQVLVEICPRTTPNEMRTAAVAKSAEIIVPTLISMYGQLLSHSSDPNSY